MPLPSVYLDDRRFQDIVDEAKGLIQRYCPEWTDHNVSDPGVALIELFAWMTDLLLYRVNQVPDKVYLKFLELIGVTLKPPRAAQVPVTFYLAAPQPNELVIPRDSEVATVRTETSPAITFTTESDLTIRPPVVLGMFTRDRRADGTDGWITHDLRKLEIRGTKLAIFPAKPGVGDAFYLAFEGDHSNHVLALVIECETAGGAGVKPTDPPLEWQIWQGGLSRWVNCEVEHDGTGGFNWSGEVILHLPAMAAAPLQGLLQGARVYWLRCQITESRDDSGAYKVSPDIQRLDVEARGGTVGARHAVTVSDEVLGQSEGKPGEMYRLLNQNILSRDPERDTLIVEPPNSPEERWHEVPDFAASQPQDPHYTLDNLSGELTLGPTLIQPDGKVYSFGRTPPKNSVLRFSRYQFGGGIIGNIPPFALSVLLTSIPYVARVANRKPAVGGLDAQSLDDARLRAPEVLRTRTRAMTSDDYEYLAREVPGVARAYCLAPGAQPADPADPKPGQVAVLVLPATDRREGRIPPEALALAADLLAAVRAYLDERRPLGIVLDVRTIKYLWVNVQARLHLVERNNPGLEANVKQRAEAELYRYLNPYTGGPDGTGWPFGRDLHVSELYGLLGRIPGVEFVEEIQMLVTEPGSSAKPQAVTPRLTVPRGALVCSEQHTVSTTS